MDYYAESIRKIIEVFESHPPERRNEEFSKLIQALGTGLGAALGAIHGRRNMNQVLEMTLISVRRTAISCHEMYFPSGSSGQAPRLELREEFLRDIFKPEKFNG